MSSPGFFGFNANPDKAILSAGSVKIKLSLFLSSLPFIILLATWIIGSEIRLAENPKDKLMPSLLSMWDAFQNIAFTPDKRKAEFILLADWLSSMGRLLSGIGLAALSSLLLGVYTGLYPGMQRMTMPFVTFLSIIPPLAILPILLITFGAGEIGKIAIIYFGTVWIMTRDIFQHVRAMPYEQIIKGTTLGASSLALTWRIIMPQVMPKLINVIRLGLGPAWLFLIAAEAIAAKSGLGYRIFLVRRYIAMDLIIPYVMVITATGFLMDLGLRKTLSWLFPWYVAINGKEN